MSSIRWALALCLVSTAVANEPQSNSQEGLVVLRNGRVLRGTVFQTGDLYQLVYPNGDEVRLRAAAVDFVCRDLAQAYQLKRLTIDTNNSREHLDLAEWCLTQDLRTEATAHLKVAKSLDAYDPRIDYIERRIKNPPQQAATEKTKQSAALPSKDVDLDEFTAQLPPEAIEKFVSQVQPILVNRCSTSGCHSESSTSKMRFIRTSPGRVFARRFTQRNLFTTMQFINESDPQKSPLLKVPLTAHGTAERAVFGPATRDQHNRLVEWVAMVTRKSNTSPDKIDSPTRHLLQAAGIKTTSQDPSPQAATPKPFEHIKSRVIEPNDIPMVAPAKSAKKLQFVPIDAFDPEIFNRRFDTAPKSSKSQSIAKSPRSSASKN